MHIPVLDGEMLTIRRYINPRTFNFTLIQRYKAAGSRQQTNLSYFTYIRYMSLLNINPLPSLSDWCSLTTFYILELRVGCFFETTRLCQSIKQSIKQSINQLQYFESGCHIHDLKQ